MALILIVVGLLFVLLIAVVGIQLQVLFRQYDIFPDSTPPQTTVGIYTILALIAYLSEAAIQRPE